MDMNYNSYLDPLGRRYAAAPALTMPPSYGPTQPVVHPPIPQYQVYPAYQPTYWTAAPYYAYQRGMYLPQGAVLTKPTEPKPRLAKDEVELLESEFAKNPKPSSSVKRELAEQMGVEVPRINNWFQNRRAKEKQLRKTAEFEAQQAREREKAAAEAAAKAAAEKQNHEAAGDSKDEDKQQDSSSTSNAPQSEANTTIKAEEPTVECKAGDQVSPSSSQPASAPTNQYSFKSTSDNFSQVKVENSVSPVSQSQLAGELTPRPMTNGSYSESQNHSAMQQQMTLQQSQTTAYDYQPADRGSVDGFPPPVLENVTSQHSDTAISEAAAFSPFPEPDYFSTPTVSQFQSDMISAVAPSNPDNQFLRHQPSTESLAQSEGVSPSAIPDSPSTVSSLRFKSPPPPADIAGRRKIRRPAPLGLSALRVGSGPKTGAPDAQRRDLASPLRRISSATGPLCGRVQKTSYVGSGPRSPFAMDRTKEVLLQSIQSTQAGFMPSLNGTISPLSPEGFPGQSLTDSVVGATTASLSSTDDEKSTYPFTTLGTSTVIHSLPPLYNAGDVAVRSPPNTPGLPMSFTPANPTTNDPYFSASSSLDPTWKYMPTSQDDPLQTPGLVSHTSSELDFPPLQQQQLPGYVASQPQTPSFPPTTGAVGSVFPTTSLYTGNPSGVDYHPFPESTYPTDSSAKSSPVAPVRPMGSVTLQQPTKQFQFAQNVTPQDFGKS